MHFVPPPHELVTRTPALDDTHQSVDTLGMLLSRGRFILAGSVLCNLFAVQRHTLSTRFAPPPHELVTRTPALDDAHQSVDTLGMFLRRGRFVLAGSVLRNLFAAQRHTLCTRFAPPPHELVARTPALDDAHQSVDTLGMLLRRGRFVLAGSVLRNLFAAQRHTLCTRFAPPPHELVRWTACFIKHAISDGTKPVTTTTPSATVYVLGIGVVAWQAVTLFWVLGA
ncbi:hypothetical protein B0H13DRAFT_2302469 [Mycena leptocephala]|nr:hypothetical protein B0H13DRAFT_2302469 [Mycena leptocephala]